MAVKTNVPPPASISVITVTYNARELLKATMESVLVQDTDDIEHIIIDGGSADGTVALVEERRFDYDRIGIRLIFVSERDFGIYDAMNKGMRLARGEWVNFLNAGDTYALPGTLSGVIERQDFDSLCGAARTIDACGHIMGIASPVEKLTLDRFLSGSGVCHQAWFQRRSLAPKYDTRLTLSADYKWIIYCFVAARKQKVTQEVLVNYLYGGISKRKYFTTLREKVTVIREVFGRRAALGAVVRMPLSVLRTWVLGSAKHWIMRRTGRYRKL